MNNKNKTMWLQPELLSPSKQYMIPCVLTHTHIHTNRHIHTSTYTHTYTHTYIHTHTYMYTCHTHMHAHTHTHLHNTCTCTCSALSPRPYLRSQHLVYEAHLQYREGLHPLVPRQVVPRIVVGQLLEGHTAHM